MSGMDPQPIDRKWTFDRLLGTYSDHIRLPAKRREGLFAGIRALINGRYGGRVLKHHEATLGVRRRRTRS